MPTTNTHRLLVALLATELQGQVEVLPSEKGRTGVSVRVPIDQELSDGTVHESTYSLAQSFFDGQGRSEVEAYVSLAHALVELRQAGEVPGLGSLTAIRSASNTRIRALETTVRAQEATVASLKQEIEDLTADLSVATE